jgi:cytochrome P450 family 110
LLRNSPKSPMIVQRWRWILQPLPFLEECAQNYGERFTLKLRSDMGPFLFTANPRDIQDIYTAAPGVFDSGNPPLRFLIGESALMVLSGDAHRRHRHMMLPPFHGERMALYAGVIAEEAYEQSRMWPMGQPFSALAAMQDLSIRIILRAVFGMVDGERLDEMRRLLLTLLGKVAEPFSSSLLFIDALRVNFGSFSPWGQFLILMSQLDVLLKAEIESRRQNPGVDILSLLLAATDEAGQPLSESELIDELKALLIAGHETTASSLAWALYWIHHEPEVCQRLLTELGELSPANDTLAITRLPYLGAVCSETLRILPIAIAAFARVARVPVSIQGTEYPAGTGFVPAIHLLHQRPDLYPEPKRFCPERFLERQYSPYEYMPFGGGNRRCIGAAFALMEMKLILATILQNLSLKLVSHGPFMPIRRGVTMAPPKDLRLIVTGYRDEQQPVQESKITGIKS